MRVCLHKAARSAAAGCVWPGRYAAQSCSLRRCNRTTRPRLARRTALVCRVPAVSVAASSRASHAPGVSSRYLTSRKNAAARVRTRSTYAPASRSNCASSGTLTAATLPVAPRQIRGFPSFTQSRLAAAGLLVACAKPPSATSSAERLRPCSSISRSPGAGAAAVAHTQPAGPDVRPTVSTVPIATGHAVPRLGIPEASIDP
jgi:hypothetical protein